MPTETLAATLSADRIDFINKQNARRMLASHREHISDTRRSNTDKHLEELGSRHRDERHICLASSGFGQQSLTGTGRTGQHGALGNFRTQLNVLLWVLEKIDEFHNFDFRLFAAGHVPG